MIYRVELLTGEILWVKRADPVCLHFFAIDWWDELDQRFVVSCNHCSAYQTFDSFEETKDFIERWNKIIDRRMRI